MSDLPKNSEKLIDQLRRFMRFVNDPRSRWEGFGLNPENAVHEILEQDFIAALFFTGYMSELSIETVNSSRMKLDEILQQPEAIDLQSSEWAEREFNRMTTSPNAKPPRRYQRLSQPPDIPITAEVDGETLELRSGPLPDGDQGE